MEFPWKLLGLKGGNIKLNNINIPLPAGIFLFTPFVLIPISLRFLCSSLVLIIMLRITDAPDKFENYIKTIWKILLFGLLSDFIAGLAIFIVSNISPTNWWWTYPINIYALIINDSTPDLVDMV